DRRQQIARVLAGPDGLTERFGELLAVVVALGIQPIVVESAQEIILIQANGFCVGAPGNRVLELHDIDPATRISLPLDGLVIGYQQTALRRKRAAQVMQKLTKVSARLSLRGLGP